MKGKKSGCGRIESMEKEKMKTMKNDIQSQSNFNTHYLVDLRVPLFQGKMSSFKPDELKEDKEK